MAQGQPFLCESDDSAVWECALGNAQLRFDKGDATSYNQAIRQVRFRSGRWFRRRGGDVRGAVDQPSCNEPNLGEALAGHYRR